jgi:hypothetical protein
MRTIIRASIHLLLKPNIIWKKKKTELYNTEKNIRCSIIKTEISNLVRTTRFWNNLRQVTLNIKILESQII